MIILDDPFESESKEDVERAKKFIQGFYFQHPKTVKTCITVKTQIDIGKKLLRKY